MSSRWLSAVALCLLCACTSQPHSTNASPTVVDRESAKVTPTIDRYKKDGPLTGFDIKGTSLIVYVDSEKYSQLDDSVEEDMKAALLRDWTSAWTTSHAHTHALLSVLIKNYYGQQMAALTKRV